MTELKNMVIENGNLYTDYQFYNPYEIPKNEINSWVNGELGNLTPQQAIDRFNDAEEVYPSDFQRAMVAFAHRKNDIREESKACFLSKMVTVFVLGSTMGVKPDKFIGVAMMASFFDTGEESVSDMVIMLVFLSLMKQQQEIEEMLKKINDENLKKEISTRYTNYMESPYIKQRLEEQKIQVALKNIVTKSTYKPTPWENVENISKK